MRRVQIGTCTGPAEAALVRTAFDAHGIPVLINAEHTANMLGGLGGAFVPLHVYVDEADQDEAVALFRSLREDEPEPAEPEPGDDDADQEPEPGDQVVVRWSRRRRIASTLLILLAGTAAAGYCYNRPLLLIVVIAATAGAIGGVLRTSRSGPELPPARIRRG